VPRLRSLAGAAVTIAGLTVVSSPGLAQASNGSASVAVLRSEIVNGTLLRTHGVVSACPPGNGNCQLEVVTTAPGSDTVMSTTSPAGLGATDLETAYHLPQSSVGTNGMVAVIEYGAYPVLAQDLAVYRHEYGLPPCTIANNCLKVTNITGGPPVKPGTSKIDKITEQSDAVEAALDVDMVSAACPGCHILVLEASDFIGTGNVSPDKRGAAVATAYQTAVRLGAHAVSLSDFLPDTTALDGKTGAMLDHVGVPLFASAGDIPPADPDQAAGPADNAGWPQDLPWVVSVGATLLKPVNPARTRFIERASPNYVGSCSPGLASADGQPAKVAAYCGGHRAAVDMAADADVNTGPAVYDTYAPWTHKPPHWFISGGTSASSPFVAAWYARSAHTALAEKAHGPSALYSAPASSFNKITTGKGNPAICKRLGWPTVMCQAGPGWNGPTGLGSPHGLGSF
jgi:subtilase family serine protease